MTAQGRSADTGDAVSVAGAVDTGAVSPHVQRVRASIRHSSHGRSPSVDVHPMGHDCDEAVRSLAHIYLPWASTGANGSGIVAMAAWARRLEAERREAGAGIGEPAAATEAATFMRGLIHR